MSNLRFVRGDCARLSAVSHELAVAAVAVPVDAGRCHAEAEVLAALARVPEAEPEGLRFFTDEVRSRGPSHTASISSRRRSN